MALMVFDGTEQTAIRGSGAAIVQEENPLSQLLRLPVKCRGGPRRNRHAAEWLLLAEKGQAKNRSKPVSQDIVKYLPSTS